MNLYNYEKRSSILPVSWEDFHGLCKALSKCITSQFEPEIIIAVGRGGYYPGTLIAHILRTRLYPVIISRRVKDVVKFKVPQWNSEPPLEVKDSKVLIVDEISSTGETLQIVKEKVNGMGASEIKCAVLYAHTSGASLPDYIGIITDKLIINPWDREVFSNGKFRFHPEYVQALSHQKIKPDKDFLIKATRFILDKPKK